jgi:hypothetical protein
MAGIGPPSRRSDMSFESEVRKVLLEKISETLTGQTIQTPQDGEAKIERIEPDSYEGIPVLIAHLAFADCSERFILEANLLRI